jgi:hypothetical protein
VSENPYPENPPGQTPAGGGYLPGGYQPQGTQGHQGYPGGPVLPSGATNPFGPPPTASQPNTSAIVLTVLSGIATLSVYCACIGIPPLIFGILGITKQSTDPEGAARMTKIGWIVFAVMSVLALLAIAGFIAFAVMSESSSSSTYPTY